MVMFVHMAYLLLYNTCAWAYRFLEYLITNENRVNAKPRGFRNSVSSSYFVFNKLIQLFLNWNYVSQTFDVLIISSQMNCMFVLSKSRTKLRLHDWAWLICICWYKGYKHSFDLFKIVGNICISYICTIWTMRATFIANGIGGNKYQRMLVHFLDLN